MPSSIPRIQITPSCQSHSDLLTYWAKLEGRSIGSLCSSLLEDAIYRAIESGRANATAIQLMKNVIKQRERALEFTHQFHLQEENLQAEHVFDSEQQKVWEAFDGGDREYYCLHEKPHGVFTDERWGNNYEKNVKEEETVTRVLDAAKILDLQEIKNFDIASEILIEFPEVC